MAADFYLIFYYGVLLTGAGIGLFYIKKVDTPFRWLCMLLIITLLSEAVGGYLSLHHIPNGLVYVIFTPIEYFMYAMVYKLFFNDKKWTRLLFGSIACLILLEMINIIFFQQPDEAPTNIMNIESVLLVILSLKLFIDIREKPIYDSILNEGVFWFNSAVLIYYAFSVLIWGLHSLIFRLKDPPHIIYQILLLFSGFLYLAYTASIILNRVSTIKAANRV